MRRVFQTRNLLVPSTKLIKTNRAYSTANYSKYLYNLGSDIKDKTAEISHSQLQSLVETGANQAIKALGTIENQLNEMNTESISSSVTFNAGILQITFTSTGSKTTKSSNSTIKKDQFDDRIGSPHH